MLFQKSCVVIATVFALSSAAAAHAEPGGDVRHEAVRIDDIDPTLAADARLLNARLQKAAKDVCSPVDAVLVDEIECRRDAFARAVDAFRRLQTANFSAQFREMTSNSILARGVTNTAP